MVYTSEAFDKMVSELLEQTPPAYDTLCALAYQTLWRTLCRWCREEPLLKGCEEDLFQDICLRLITATIPGFLLRSGVEGPVNRDPQGFSSWMFTVAANMKNDLLARIRRERWNRETAPLEELLLAAPVPEHFLRQEQADRLLESLDTVLKADIRIYKTLTWLAMAELVWGWEIPKDKTSDLIDRIFRDKTLAEMYRLLLLCGARLRWLCLSQDRQARLSRELARPLEDGTYGDARYRTFYMKKGGKASISDWINRVNSIIRRAVEDGASDNG